MCKKEVSELTVYLKNLSQRSHMHCTSLYIEHVTYVIISSIFPTMMLAIPIPIIWIEVVNPRAVPMWGIEHFLISNNVKNYYEGKKKKKKGPVV